MLHKLSLDANSMAIFYDMAMNRNRCKRIYFHFASEYFFLFKVAMLC